MKLRVLLAAALLATATLWPPLQRAYAWVWQAAHFLGDNGPGVAQQVSKCLGGLLGAMVRYRKLTGSLVSGIDHFVKVTRSYWSGLCHCYTVPDLPRTNNDLEHVFGSHRYHERRASGRKRASPGLVVRGEVRLLAALATREHVYSAAELAGVDPQQQAELRQRLEARRQRRVNRWRFRRNPQAFLQKLEEDLLKARLPS